MSEINPENRHITDRDNSYTDSGESSTEIITSDARTTAEKFITENAENLSLLMGVSGVSIEVGSGWATNLKTGIVTVDPSFFVEQGYKTPWVNYALLHEISAHLIGVIDEPEQTRERIDFVGHDRAKHIFINILEDISGNKRIHSLLPRQSDVASDIYSEKLFSEEDYSTSYPKHIQFLYKMIRDEMIPESQTIVEPEVDEALAGLRNKDGQDVIKISTARFKGNSYTELDKKTQFLLWTTYIFPQYQKLLELDKQDPRFDSKKQQSGDSNDSSQSVESGNPADEGESQEQQSGDSNDSSQSVESGNPADEGESQESGDILDSGEAGQGGEEKSGNSSLDDFYDDYETNRHPEPVSHEEMEEILNQSFEKKKQEKKTEKENSPEQRAQKNLEERLGGHSIATLNKYRQELQRLYPEIKQMTDFFSSLLDERVIMRRKLTRSSPEGVILDPSNLAQTLVDLKSGIKNPPSAFLDYEKHEAIKEANGKFDCFLAVDCSGSMDGNRRAEARRAASIFLEGLSAFQRQIEDREQQGSFDLDWDVRTSIYKFGSGAEEIKALSHSLSEKERLDVFSSIDSSGRTEDYLALEQIYDRIAAEISSNAETKSRRRIVIVITDGESSDPERLSQSIDQLKKLNVSILAIGIETDSIGIYPSGKSINDVKSLAETLSELLKKEISR
jgi:Mg-chelatase subunit ChlD